MSGEMNDYHLSVVAVEANLKKSQRNITLCMVSFVLFLISGVYYQNWKETANLDYIGGNILYMAGSTTGSVGAVWKNDSFQNQLVYASLFETDSSFTEVNPYLCSSYEMLDHGYTYKITLKDDLNWSDGHPLTMDDVVFSIETFILNLGSNTTITYAFSKLKGYEEWREIGYDSWKNGGTHSFEGISTEDNVLTFHLETPYSAFAVALTQFIILPQHCLHDVDPTTFHEITDFFQESTVSSGMFMVEGRNEAGEMVFVQNPYYHGEYSDIEKVVMCPDYNHRHIDYYTTSNITEMVSYRAMSGFVEYDVDVEWYRYFVFNLMASFEQSEMVSQKDEDGNVLLVETTEMMSYPESREENYPMQDIRVRQAISLALDRASMQREVYIGTGSYDFSSTGNQQYSDFLTDYNPTKAKQLLEESSYDLNRPLTIGYYHTDDNTEAYLARVKEYLEEVGFTVMIKKTSGSDALYVEREYDFYLKAYPAYSILDWYNEYLTSNDNLHVIIGTDEFDQLLIDLDATTNDTDYLSVMTQIQELDMNTMYKLPLVSLTDAVYINSNRLSMPDDMTFGNVRYRSALRLDEWYIKKG